MKCPAFAAIPTIVGSFPHTEARSLVERIFSRFPDMPAWPQLPVRDWLESMYVQYSEGLPGAVVDRAAQTIYFRSDEALAAELEAFYQALVDEDVERFAVSREYALGLHLFLESGQRPKWVKGQVTGPFSFAMTVTDENKRSLAYNPELYEVAVQGMAMKARWVARKLRKVAEGVLVVLDEPYLCAFGSAFVNVPRNDVVAAIDAGVAAIHKEGALAGLHCCGNTDWSMVFATGVDVVHFDAYEYMEPFVAYDGEIAEHLGRGGSIAWGIVPKDETVFKVSCEDLESRLEGAFDMLEARGLDRETLAARALVSPSCGLGPATVEVAERALRLTSEVSAAMRDRYF